MKRRGIEAVISAVVLTLLLVGTAGRVHADASDILLYASDFTTHGNWTLASGSDAAGGQKLSSADNSW